MLGEEFFNEKKLTDRWDVGQEIRRYVNGPVRAASDPECYRRFHERKGVLHLFA